MICLVYDRRFVRNYEIAFAASWFPSQVRPMLLCMILSIIVDMILWDYSNLAWYTSNQVICRISIKFEGAFTDGPPHISVNFGFL